MKTSIRVWMRLLTVLPFLFSMVHSLQAQRVGLKILPVGGRSVFTADLPAGTRLVRPHGWPDTARIVLLQTLDDRYVIGSNAYADREFGQVYPAVRLAALHGIYVRMDRLEGNSGRLHFRVREYGRAPGRVIADRAMPVADARAGQDEAGWLYVELGRVALPTRDYYIGVGLPDNREAIIGMSTAHLQDAVGAGMWAQAADGTWMEPEKTWSGSPTGLRLELFPVISGLADFAGGTGTRADPFQVADAGQLNDVRNFPTAHFIQVADIDLGGSPWSTGEGWLPIADLDSLAFSGGYDGGGYAITGLTIRRPGMSHVGLFGRATSAEFTRVTLRDADVTGLDGVGALVGTMIDGTLERIRVDGSVAGQGYVGGVAGSAGRTRFDDCEYAGFVEGRHHVGGLAGVGRVEHGRTEGHVTGIGDAEGESYKIGGLLGEGFALNSQSSAVVTGGSEVGGLIGSGTAYGCRATGDVTATGDEVGGLIGRLSLTDADTEPDYAPGEPASESTVAIRDSVSGDGSGPITIILEDETIVTVYGNGLPLRADLDRLPADVDLDPYLGGTGLRQTGSMRRLIIEGEDDPSGIKPVLTIPLAEAGTIDPATLVILRVGHLYVDNVLVEQHGVILPIITVDETSMKFMDAVFPDAVTERRSPPGPPAEGMRAQQWVGEVRYFVLTFDQTLNWAQRPILERMIPDSTGSGTGFRRLARNASKGELQLLAHQPICNVVILVHGHNEEEHDGYLAARIASPWNFRYKRMVWDILYEEAVKAEESVYGDECTAFYEYIFPTYRAIFSPVPDKSGFRHATLGEDLGRLINEEFEDNPQLKAMLDEDMAFNIYIVAHSQGGLVTRAGLRFVNERILRHLKKVVTWGSPHHGAGLYSLRYALAVGHDIVIDGFRFPMQNIGQSQAYQSAVAALAMDAPGIRDLRWDASKKGLMRLGDLLQENTTTLNEFVDTELPDGKLFYSDNLNLFNKDEGAFIGDLLRNKYMFYQGITPKDAPLEFGGSWIPFRKIIYFGALATSIEKGAQLNKLVMHDPHKTSDGAGPLFTQGANAVWGDGGIQRRLLDDIDHEEFYGSEPPNRTGASIAKGLMVTRQTFSDLEFGAPRSQCPKIDVERDIANDTLFLEGAVDFPVYLPEYGGDGLLGERIVRMEARSGRIDGALIPELKFEYDEEGLFTAKGPVSGIPIGNDTLVIAAILRDSSVIIGTSIEAIPWKRCIIDFQIRFGEVEHTYPSMFMDTTYEVIGHSTASSGNLEIVGEFDGRTFEGTSANGREEIRVTLDPTGEKIESFAFTLSATYANIFLAGHDIPLYSPEFYDNFFNINADAQTCNYVTDLKYWLDSEWGSFRLLSYACADDLNYISIIFLP